MSEANASARPERPQALVYVVDDEPMLLELAAVILEPFGYRVKTFQNAELALEAFKTAQPKPELVMTDYAMHRMNGMDLVKACRELVPGQKVVLISGTVGPEIYAHERVKPDRFLAKPYHAKQLVKLVKNVL
jgi:DNA-binding NtrC family response regulator